MSILLMFVVSRFPEEDEGAGEVPAPERYYLLSTAGTQPKERQCSQVTVSEFTGTLNRMEWGVRYPMRPLWQRV
jgi:hypothetical protein